MITRPRIGRISAASCSFLHLLLALFILFLSCHASQETESSSSKKASSDSNSKERKKLISLAESTRISRRSFQDPEIEETRRQYWTRAFEEIKNLSLAFPGNRDAAAGGGTFLNQWKLLLDVPEIGTTSLSVNASSVGANDTAHRSAKEHGSSLRRFQGFPSWERMLQEWADDVQEYLESVQAESDGQYAMGNFGRSSSAQVVSEKKEKPAIEPSTHIHESEADLEGHDVNASTTSVTVTEKTRKRHTLPIPAPAKPGEPVLPHTDISDKSKRIEIVTTASLPWRTGTAVNPLLRAAYLTKGRKEAGGSVTLMLPWLERQADQENVYGVNNTFDTPDDQEAYIRTWLRESAGMEQASEHLKIRWYTAWQNRVENSIYSMGDITALTPADEVDICILEEPEHLNWYRAPGESWTKKFKHVVGILHTNYFQYALDQPAALIRAPAMRLLCSWMCRAHCHRVIKLSGTLDKVAPEKELVENVHGVRGTFLDVGEEVRKKIQSSSSSSDPVFGPNAEPTIYFVGKMLWSKGLGSLMELLKYAEESASLKVTVDMYGGGPDQDAADAKAKKLGLNLPFHGPLDHAELAFSHKIFLNPSTSEVLCTTSAEALAMGKFVILPSHPSNDFFAQFPNCLTYATKEEFVGNLYYAITHSPEPLTTEFAHALSWDAATERLEAAGCIPVEESEKMVEALSSEDAGIEINLPPLVESEEGRRGIANALRYTRSLYRQFRTRLSADLRQDKVLPKALKERLIRDLDTRLDLDLDEVLASPKLQLKLSPAELDKSLLVLYNKISEGPSGDVLRVIGGGGPIGLQNLYIRRQSLKERQRSGSMPDLFPSFIDHTETDEVDRTATQWVRWALKRNLPKEKDRVVALSSKASPKHKSFRDETPRMCSSSSMPTYSLKTWTGLRSPSGIGIKPRGRGSRSFSLVI